MFCTKKTSLLRIVVIIALAINGIFTLVMLGHSIFVYNYFRGPPPTKNYQVGQIILTVSLACAIFTIVFALFVKLFDFKSLIVVIIIDVGFALAIILSIFAVYYFRDTKPTIAEFQSYSQAHFKKHRRPPPFFNKIQHEMLGYCCGASSYLDYVEGDSDFFEIPHSCCFQKQRETNPECGRHEYKYLYQFLQSKMRKILDTLEKQYVDTDDIMAVLLKVTAEDSPEFIRANYKAMLYDREANIKKNMSSQRYQQLQQEEERINPYLDGNQVTAKISQRISLEAVAELNELQYQFTDPNMIMFLPIGCLELMDEIKTHKWKGFRRFKFVRTRVISTFQGILGMVICNLLFLIISVILFNLKGQAIDKEHRLTAFKILHNEKAKKDGDQSLDETNELSTVSAAEIDSEGEEEELRSLAQNSRNDIQ